MSNSSSLSYRSLLIPHFLEVLKIMDEVFTTYNTPYYLIGVNATDLQLLKEGIKPSRGTKDIDFAVMLSSFAEYNKITDALEEKGFRKAKDPFTLYHAALNVAIDVLPFGQIEENDTINFTEREVIMNVLGFKETLTESTEVSVDETFSIQVPPLHGMVVLKLIAWSDRPEIRATDLDDIYRIVKHYFHVESETIFNDHFDLLGIEPFNELLIAARVLGRNISKVLDKSVRLKKRVLAVLTENTSDPAKSSIGKHWAGKYQIDVEYAINILQCIKTGIEE
jgi:predicted nucleotidyltransferase